MNDKVKYLIALPKSLMFCFRVFPFCTAIKVPMLVSLDTKLYGCKKNSIELINKASFGQVRIGFWEGAGRMGYKQKTILNIDKNALLVLGKNICVAKGSVIRVISGGKCTLMDDFKGNYGLKIMCRKSVTFGKNSLIAWDCTFTDGDGHQLLNDGIRVNDDEKIYIGDNCWICAESAVLKGSEIPSNSVVGYGTIVNKKFKEIIYLY